MKNLDREKIIEALQRFDEGSQGDIFDEYDTKTLYKRLNNLTKYYTAEDLIIAASEGF